MKLIPTFKRRSQALTSHATGTTRSIRYYGPWRDIGEVTDQAEVSAAGILHAADGPVHVQLAVGLKGQEGVIKNIPWNESLLYDSFPLDRVEGRISVRWTTNGEMSWRLTLPGEAELSTNAAYGRRRRSNGQANVFKLIHWPKLGRASRLLWSLPTVLIFAIAVALVIIYLTNAKPAPSAKLATTSPPSSTPIPTDIYVVKVGDTSSGICVKVKPAVNVADCVADLRQLNGGSNNLEIGQWLRLSNRAPIRMPSTYPPATTPAPAAVLPCDKSQSPLYCLYTVEQGDTVAGIARRFGLKGNLSEDVLPHDLLVNSNKPEVSARELLRVGQKLRIPTQNGVIHTVLGPQTLGEVADQYGVVSADILAVVGNGISDPNGLRIGQEILVPNPTRFAKLSP